MIPSRTCKREAQVASAPVTLRAIDPQIPVQARISNWAYVRVVSPCTAVHAPVHRGKRYSRWKVCWLAWKPRRPSIHPLMHSPSIIHCTKVRSSRTGWRLCVSGTTWRNTIDSSCRYWADYSWCCTARKNRTTLMTPASGILILNLHYSGNILKLYYLYSYFVPFAKCPKKEDSLEFLLVYVQKLRVR